MTAETRKARPEWLLFVETLAAYGQGEKTAHEVLLAARAHDAALTKLDADEGAEWQPIETAPKDGTEVLLCQAVNSSGKPISEDAWGLFVQRAAWWEGEDGGNGAWVVYCDLIQEPRLSFDPTHWMPLPSPPALVAKPAGVCPHGCDKDGWIRKDGFGGAACQPYPCPDHGRPAGEVDRG